MITWKNKNKSDTFVYPDKEKGKKKSWLSFMYMQNFKNYPF